jgi:hypothetical protein
MIINPYIFGGFDPDAQAFITAANITNTTQQNAINTLVVSLKGYGVWTKMKAIYPFVGGTASTHKWNLKDPRDLDAAFRLVFNGGWTHSSTGALPNGTNAFADTYLIGNSVLNSINDVHFSIYSRSNTIQIAGHGTYNNDNLKSIVILERNNSGLFASAIGVDNIGVIVSTTNTLGFYLSSRTSSTLLKSYKNNTILGSNTTNSNGQLPITKLSLAAIRTSSTLHSAFNNRELAFSSIGDGLTDTETTNLYLAVQNYQVALSRQV